MREDHGLTKLLATYYILEGGIGSNDCPSMIPMDPQLVPFNINNSGLVPTNQGCPIH